MKIDHVHFYTGNAARTRDWFIHNVGFQVIGKSISKHTHTEVIALNSAFFVISSPLNSNSPVAQYLDYHPSGVVDIAFRIEDVQSITSRASHLGVEILQHPKICQSPQGRFKYAKIIGWKSLQHTLIETTSSNFDYCLPNIEIDKYQDKHQAVNSFDTSITNIDHIVLNVASGQLNPAVKLYQALFRFKIQQSFNIQTERSGLYSQALIDDGGEVQFNINEPTTANSQIQEFIDLNGGSGIQHLALRSQNIIADVAQMQQNRPNGISFLTIPQAYYSQLNRLPSLSIEEWQAIANQQILIDCDRHNSQSLLMQIFTQPIFEQPTFFLEFIERRHAAKGFGQGNFKTLFEAVERESPSNNNCELDFYSS